MARILVVDDDPEILQIARQILASEQHDVVTAEDVSHALVWLKDSAFDLVITDANMPLATGYDLIQTVRNDQRWSDMPIAMLTSRRERESVDRALHLGANEYLLKPIDPFQFKQRIGNLLSLSPHIVAYEVPLRGKPALANGHLQLPIQIQSISEFGLVFVSAQRLQVGERIDCEIPLFSEIGVTPPTMKTLSSIACSAIKDRKSEKGFETRVVFLATNETFLRKIRAWMIQNPAQSFSGAA